MEYVAPLDPAQLALVTAGAVALTQIMKDLGVAGEWLKVVCIGWAALLGSILMFAPNLWFALVAPLLGAIGTGGVSFVKDLRAHGPKPAGD